MTLCGIDPNHYQGTITWTPLTAEDYWSINMDSLTIGTTAITNTTASAIVDTGTSLIIGNFLSLFFVQKYFATNLDELFLPGPSEDIIKIQRIIGGTELTQGEYVVDCNGIASLPNVVITIGGQPLTVIYRL